MAERGRRGPPIFVLLLAVAVLLAGSVAGAALLAESERKVFVDRITEPLGDTKRLDLWVAFGLGSLRVDSLPHGSRNLVEGAFETTCSLGPEVSFQRRGDRASLGVEREDLDIERDGGGFSICVRNSDWRVSLSRVPEVAVALGTAAVSIDLDLTDLRVTSLYVQTGAADVDIRMPADAGDMEAMIDAGAASIDVLIPDGVAARIVNDTGLSSFNVSRRFLSLERTGEYRSAGETIGGRSPGNIYESPGYRDAENRIHIEFNGGVSSVTVR